MLCSRLERLERLTERRYIAEPRLDGQRAQVQIRDGRTVACCSRPGRDLLRHPGMAWLRGMTWPGQSAALDGEACAGDGHEGVHAVFEERGGWALMSLLLLELRPDRPFVVHLDVRAQLPHRMAGRVEHVTSGEVARFTSLGELMAFMTKVLRNQVRAERGTVCT